MSLPDIARHRLASILFALTLVGIIAGCGDGRLNNGSSSSPTVTSDPPLSVVNEVSGWASQGAGTTGGELAPATNIYKVCNRAELLAALANTSSPTYAINQTVANAEPKIIYVMGSI